jgi:hypothetical protein
MNYAKEKPVPEGSTLRMRRCCGRDCGVVFFVCIGCDRGQRYCSDACREAARRRQTRAANSRYQRSETGKQTHRLRQRAYRKRTLERSVTYQGHTSAPAPPAIRSLLPPTCLVCRHRTVWINPYPALPYRLRRHSKARRRNRSATGHFSTLSDGR